MNKNNKTIKATDVAALAKMFGVDFEEKDVNTLQSWINEEENNKEETELNRR